MEVVLAYRAHVGQEPLAGLHPEPPERHALPRRRGLDHLRLHRVQVAVVRDVDADRRPRPVAVEVVAHAARGPDDERHLHGLQDEPLAQPVLDQPLGGVERAHGLTGSQERRVVGREHVLELLVAADSRPREVVCWS